MGEVGGQRARVLLVEQHDLEDCLVREVGKSGSELDAPAVDVLPETNLMVIYTSGITGLPANRLAYAIGNGAAPPALDKFTR